MLKLLLKEQLLSLLLLQQLLLLLFVEWGLHHNNIWIVQCGSLPSAGVPFRRPGVVVVNKQLLLTDGGTHMDVVHLSCRWLRQWGWRLLLLQLRRRNLSLRSLSYCRRTGLSSQWMQLLVLRLLLKLILLLLRLLLYLLLVC